MTDPTPLTDEELSAHVDDPSDDTLRARIAADPAAARRADELRQARNALAAPVPALSGTQVEHIIATALAADAGSDRSQDSDPDGEIVAPAVPIGSRRRSAGAPRWIAAAAAVVLLAGVGFILSGALGGSSGSDTAKDSATASQSFNKVGAPVSTTVAATPEASSAGGSAATDHLAGTFDEAAARTFATKATDLGVFTTDDALRASLKTAWPTAPATKQSGVTADQRTAQQIARCATQVQTVLRLTSGPTNVGYATLRGKPVLVFEFAGTSFKDGNPTTIVSAADPTACDPKVTFER